MTRSEFRDLKVGDRVVINGDRIDTVTETVIYQSFKELGDVSERGGLVAMMTKCPTDLKSEDFIIRSNGSWEHRDGGIVIYLDYQTKRWHWANDQPTFKCFDACLTALNEYRRTRCTPSK